MQTTMTQDSRLPTLDPMRMLFAPLIPSPHSNSSHGKCEGALGAYNGVKENLCLHTCQYKTIRCALAVYLSMSL